MRIMDGDKNEATSVSTTAGDGALVIWNLNSLSSILENLNIQTSKIRQKCTSYIGCYEFSKVDVGLKSF